MSSVRTLNPKAEVLGRQAALFMNINAAKGLHDVMKTNLGGHGGDAGYFIRMHAWDGMRG